MGREYSLLGLYWMAKDLLCVEVVTCYIFFLGNFWFGYGLGNSERKKGVGFCKEREIRVNGKCPEGRE